MRFKLGLGLALSLLVTSFAVAGGDVPFAFSFTGGGGLIPSLPSDPDGPDGPLPPDPTTGYSLFSLNMDPSIQNIQSLELVLNGLTHTSPADLDIILLGPLAATSVEVMNGVGDHHGAVDLTIVFNDSAPSSPPLSGPLTGGPYLPQGPGGMANFNGLSGGPGPWYLFVIDQATGDRGALESFTLRGTAVPEPVTLSLLALGALTFLRRRRA
jgi:hypothetical protein